MGLEAGVMGLAQFRATSEVMHADAVFLSDLRARELLGYATKGVNIVVQKPTLCETRSLTLVALGHYLRIALS
jgi:hypothetical protein